MSMLRFLNSLPSDENNEDASQNYIDLEEKIVKESTELEKFRAAYEGKNKRAYLATVNYFTCRHNATFTQMVQFYVAYCDNL